VLNTGAEVMDLCAVFADFLEARNHLHDQLRHPRRLLRRTLGLTKATERTLWRELELAVLQAKECPQGTALRALIEHVLRWQLAVVPARGTHLTALLTRRAPAWQHRLVTNIERLRMARHELWLALMPLAHYHARRTLNGNSPLLTDLVQELILALEHAARVNFDPERGTQLSTFLHTVAAHQSAKWLERQHYRLRRVKTQEFLRAYDHHRQHTQQAEPIPPATPSRSPTLLDEVLARLSPKDQFLVSKLIAVGTSDSIAAIAVALGCKDAAAKRSLTRMRGRFAVVLLQMRPELATSTEAWLIQGRAKDVPFPKLAEQLGIKKVAAVRIYHRAVQRLFLEVMR
jgi:RNA polymerase sigma factor (sigma-70 family)